MKKGRKRRRRRTESVFKVEVVNCWQQQRQLVRNGCGFPFAVCWSLLGCHHSFGLRLFPKQMKRKADDDEDEDDDSGR